MEPACALGNELRGPLQFVDAAYNRASTMRQWLDLAGWHDSRYGVG
jgi:hypothetical protein